MPTSKQKRRDGNKEKDITIDGGFIEVIKNNVTILIDGTIN